MKKKHFFILVLICIIITIFLVTVFRRNNYTIEVNNIDNFSPDRKLIVYKNNKKIKYKEIQYIDGTFLCSSTNPTVSYSEIDGIEKLVIKIGKKKIIAKIVENRR